MSASSPPQTLHWPFIRHTDPSKKTPQTSQQANIQSPQKTRRAGQPPHIQLFSFKPQVQFLHLQWANSLAMPSPALSESLSGFPFLYTSASFSHFPTHPVKSDFPMQIRDRHLLPALPRLFNMAKSLPLQLKPPLAELPRWRKNQFSKRAAVEVILGYSRKEL